MRTRTVWQRAAILAALFVVCVAAFLTTGCARVSTLTEVRADGSLTRTVTLRGAGASQGGMSMGPSLTDLVDAPTGAEWKVTRETDESEMVLTATRSVPAGAAPWSDVAVRGEPVEEAPAAPPAGAPGPIGPHQAKPKPGAKPAQKPAQKPPAKPAPPKPAPPPEEPTFTFSEPKKKPGPVNVVNEVSVRMVAPGRLEYREVYRWKGKRPEELAAPDNEIDDAFKKGLPPELAADPAFAKAIQTSVEREVMKMIFGPGEPLFPLLIFHTEYAEYRLRRRLVAAVRKAFQENPSAKLTEEQRRAAERQIVDAITRSVTAKSKSSTNPNAAPPSAEGEKKGDGGPPVALFVRVKMPGKVIATNGEYDEDLGEVVWPLYAQAAGVEDVVLTATCEVGAK